jgi:hypothetical protein
VALGAESPSAGHATTPAQMAAQFHRAPHAAPWANVGASRAERGRPPLRRRCPAPPGGSWPEMRLSDLVADARRVEPRPRRSIGTVLLPGLQRDERASLGKHLAHLSRAGSRKCGQYRTPNRGILATFRAACGSRAALDRKPHQLPIDHPGSPVVARSHAGSPACDRATCYSIHHDG